MNTGYETNLTHYGSAILRLGTLDADCWDYVALKFVHNGVRLVEWVDEAHTELGTAALNALLRGFRILICAPQK